MRNASLFLYGGVGATLVLGVLMAFFITRDITRPIQRIIAGLAEGASQVASASQQAAALEETSSSLEEMASMTVKNASQAKVLVSWANESMGQLTQAMADISAAGEETGKDLRTIDEIAF